MVYNAVRKASRGISIARLLQSRYAVPLLPSLSFPISRNLHFSFCDLPSMRKPQTLQAAGEDFGLPLGARGRRGVGTRRGEASLNEEQPRRRVAVGRHRPSEGDIAEVLERLGQLEVGQFPGGPGAVALGELLGADGRQPQQVVTAV